MGPQCRRPFSLSHINFPIFEISLNVEKKHSAKSGKEFEERKIKIKWEKEKEKETIEQNGVCVHMCWCICMTPNQWKRLRNPLPQNFSFISKPKLGENIHIKWPWGWIEFPFFFLSYLCFTTFFFMEVFTFHPLFSISLYRIQLPLPFTF